MNIYCTRCFYYLYAAPNSGITHWFQQFCAIFLKGVYNSVRSYIALISQLVLPILFILIGLILAKTTPSVIDDDPKRSIELRTSAVSTNNLTLFFAQFGDLPLNNSSNFTFAVRQGCLCLYRISLDTSQKACIEASTVCDIQWFQSRE